MMKKSWLNFSVLLLLCIALFTACRHNSITPLDTAPTVSFQADVLPVIIANCTEAGCHGQGGSDLKLLTYDEIMRRVTPGKPHSSDLYKVITANTGNVMPQPPNPRLTDNQIKLIFVWISQGAKNN